MRQHLPSIWITCLLAAHALWAFAAEASGELQFNRDIRPILSAHCYHCHGPDKKHREADLQLDRQDGIDYAFGETDLADNEAWQRLISTDPDDQMPPPTAHTKVTPEELARLKQWIAQGAKYQGHWSLIAPTRPELPPVKNTSWVRNPIDAFVLSRLERQGLAPNRAATRQQLLRRLTLDLTGLPPTVAEVDAFLADESPHAYEKVVDRLLASPHFGERVAVPWLDAARYADTNGFSIDDHRDMWLWREWVIDALNRNMPYEQFVIEQLAGDLLPAATDRQHLATGFLRNSMNTHEGGTLPEEYRVIYIADKIDTVSTVFMGLTMRCAQCHSHKYDPITQQDYYKFYAFFDTAHEPGMGANNGNTAPIQRMDGLITDAAIFKADIQQRIATLRRYLLHPPELIKARAAWEATTAANAKGDLAEAINTPVDRRSDEHWATINGAYAKTTQLWSRHISSINREIAVLDRDLQAGKSSVMVMKEEGPRQTYVLTRGQYDQPDKQQPVSPGVPAALPPLDQNQPPTTPIVRTAEPWQSAWWIWDNAGAASGDQENTPRYFRFVLDLATAPAHAELRATADNRCTTYVNGHPLGTNDPWMTPARYDVTKHLAKGRNVIAVQAANAGGPAGLLASLIVDGNTAYGSDKRWKVSTAENVDWTDAAFDDTTWSPASELGPASMAPWNITAGPTSTQTVDPSNPTRLTLARWLTRDDHPLTARVAVNRYWQMLFGRGLVSTPDDFGSQGTFPTHPALLDWLAIEYSQNGWDTKRLIKTMVMSATYRQSSSAPRSLIERDPRNELLARAPRYRLSAEFIRDGALAIAGTLDKRVGGPSVYPSQPHGLWREISHFGHGAAFSAQAFYPSDATGQHRRSMYTFWKRTSPPPSMIAFDAPTREVCAVQRSRTNTPLQALVLLNDPKYVAAARKLAALAMNEGGATTDDRIRFLFRRATSRQPDASESTILRGRYESALATYQQDTAAAQALVADSTAEHAAWTVVASIVLNLDEVITRE
ncbi:MAG: DUF1553 domain-containing protein [Planctomycetota bacterium]|nr:DUF1553 domain-containing protein [Planctomycetota bacterium]